MGVLGEDEASHMLTTVYISQMLRSREKQTEHKNKLFFVIKFIDCKYAHTYMY